MSSQNISSLIDSRLSQEVTKMEKAEVPGPEAMNKPVPPYARLFFDHLYSEYIALKSSIKDADLKQRLDNIHERRRQHDLTWSDIYTFDLSLVDVRPPESLVRKAYDARTRYRSVAGQKEYDEYIASKPLDLGTIQIDPDAQPAKPGAIIERELRADIKYLLNKFYLYYALLPVREAVRDNLTKKAVIVTSIAVALIALAIGLNVGGTFWIPSVEPYSAVVVTVLTVTLAGIIGGCVSMLQRIQAAPTDGDALFNLAALTNGWRGILLSPLYGGIFACLLFILFAGGILNGSVFPTIVTPLRGGATSSTPASSPSPLPTPATNVSRTASPATTVAKTESPSSSASPVSTTTAVPTPKPASKVAAASPAGPTSLRLANVNADFSPSPTPAASTSKVLQIKDFLRETGPSSGLAYALLIIWSFLAGFAERLVPDTLNRLVQKNIDVQGK
jgi:hypothetical protein